MQERKQLSSNLTHYNLLITIFKTRLSPCSQNPYLNGNLLAKITSFLTIVQLGLHQSDIN